jgi:ADP-ribose pyrophosphatase YjhB (NUDIX family)
VPYSVFIIAAGALVIKDDKLLLVQEKSGDRKGYYGLPGGRADRGEMIAHCA